MFSELEAKCKLVHQKLKSLNEYSVTGIEISPVKHLRLSNDNTLEKLEKIVDFAQTKAVSLTIARYLKEEKFPIKPSIRIAVNIDLSESEIELLVDVLEQAYNKVINV